MCCKQGCCLLCLYVCLYCLCKIGDRPVIFLSSSATDAIWIGILYLLLFLLAIAFVDDLLLSVFPGCLGCLSVFFEAFSISLSCISVDFVCNSLYISCLVIFRFFEIQKFAIFPYLYQVFSIYSNYRMFLPCAYMCKITKMDIYSQ